MLNRDEIRSALYGILKEEMKVVPERVKFTEKLRLKEDLGLSVIGTLELLMKVEDEFRFRIPEEDLTTDLTKSIRKIADYVEKRLEAQEEPVGSESTGEMKTELS